MEAAILWHPHTYESDQNKPRRTELRQRGDSRSADRVEEHDNHDNDMATVAMMDSNDTVSTYWAPRRGPINHMDC